MLNFLASIELYDVLGLIFTLVVAIIIGISYKQAGTMRANTNDVTLDYYIRIKNRYQKNCILFFGAYCWLTLFSLYATIIVLYISVYSRGDNSEKIFLYSVISLFCSIINFVINFRDIASTYRECFIIIEKELLKTRDGHDHDPDWGMKKGRYDGLYEADHHTENKLKYAIK